jgi:CHAT domain-containing protein
VFATHGLVPGDLPNLRQPALAMAANGAVDAQPLSPLLTLEDVLSLAQRRLVVLSACNTAAAQGQAEEALSGLACGFFYAGSRSLLVTHWLSRVNPPV